ncbi:hypothetical protein [Pseudobutyrivibrio xylanivorans]|uniref:Uncharacterized protein n=1 Tax=Pseudobutyrivibrio xylanivorans TaxID=185007 RepID=A0A5P6VQZ7_PSEXY|nr:hypothetical protein [Pseudobutyrivibrio xylanivorans]QFJ54910.1 hypothetical protein FXF36_08580 [Pseudobutyrivibrio xylanivorans]
MVVVFAAAVLFGIEITSIIQLRREAKELKREMVLENPIGDAYRYRFVEADYERVQDELIKFADELAYAI